MNPPIGFYPWLVNWRALVEIFLGGGLVILWLYLWLRTGRDRLESPTSHEPPVHDYAGIIQSSSNPVPTFLLWFIAALTLWTIGYIAVCAIQGGIDY